MALRLKIVGALGQKLGDRSAMEFGPSGGTIGRAPGCDWVLPDPRRYLSGRHASIDFRGGCYYIVDTSTNGVYVNDAEVPVGRGKPQRLFNGDRIRIGDYEIVAEIDDDTIERLIDQNHVEPVPLAQRVEAPEEPTSEMVDAFEMTGVGFEMKLTDDELSTLTALKGRRDDVVIELEDNAPDFARTRPSLASRGVTAPRPKAAERPQPRPAEGHSKPAVERAPAPPQAHKAPLNGSAAPRSAPTSAPHSPKPAAAPVSPAQRPAPAAPQRPTAAAKTPSPEASPAATQAKKPGPAPAAPAQKPKAPSTPAATAGAAVAAPLAAFFRGAGIDPRRLGPHDADALLHRIGQLMRELIAGVSEGVHVCTQQRNQLGIKTEDGSAQKRNPLLSEAGVDEKLLALLAQSSTPQMAVAAVRAAFGDVKLHQQVLMRAVRSALDAYIARLDPDELEQKYAGGGGRYSRLLGAANKLRYWDLYKDVYDVVAHHPPGELPMQFAEDLAAAYEREVDVAANPTEAPEPSIRVEAL